MTTTSTRSLEPWNVRAFLIGLGSVVVLAWTPRPMTEGVTGVVVLASLILVAVIGLAPLPSRRRSALQVLFDAACFTAGLFAPSLFAVVQAIQSADSRSWWIVFAAIPGAFTVALTLGALLFARVFVWCRRPRRLT